MGLDMILKERRSIRKFREEAAVNLALVREILQVAVQAPPWKNSQTARYYVVMSKEMLGRAKASYLPEFNQKNHKDTPVLIVTAFVKNHSGYDNQENPINEVGSGRGCYDLSLHDSHLILKAKDLGLDVSIMGVCDAGALGELLDIGQDQEVVSVIAVGYKDIDSAGPGRKNLDETARFH